MPKPAEPDHRIHTLITERWSPYAFEDRPVSPEDLRALFEAARWAASSFNEQPWRYIVATKDEPEEFERLLKCLAVANQDWARHVPVLAMGITMRHFSHNGKPNRVALHDLALASANLTFEATQRGLVVHQMAGILPGVARETYAIPDDADAQVALAIGYEGNSATLPEELRRRDLSPRTRRPLPEFVFAGQWGRPSPHVRS
jgi:nitroreductase